MRRQEYKIILISNEWSNNIWNSIRTRTQPVMLMMTSNGSNSSSIQLTDSEDQTENYFVGELYTIKTLLGIINRNYTLQQFYSESSIWTLHCHSSTRNHQSELNTATVLHGMTNTVYLPEMTSHHGCQLIGSFISRDINTSNHSLQYKFVR